MQRNAQRVVPFENIQEGKVAVLIGLLDNPIKVSDRLMIMRNQTQSNVMSHSLAAVKMGKIRDSLVPGSTCQVQLNRTIGKQRACGTTFPGQPS